MCAIKLFLSLAKKSLNEVMKTFVEINFFGQQLSRIRQPPHFLDKTNNDEEEVEEEDLTQTLIIKKVLSTFFHYLTFIFQLLSSTTVRVHQKTKTRQISVSDRLLFSLN